MTENNYRNREVSIDFESALVDSLTGQILNNEVAYENYVSILARVFLKVDLIIKERAAMGILGAKK